MFESAELGNAVDDATYEKKVASLRNALLAAQTDLLEDKSFPVIVLVNGVDGAGKGSTVNLLNEWMDPRHIQSRAFGLPTHEERARPPMWRFWNALPPKGKLGILFGSWYTQPVLDRVEGKVRDAELAVALERIRQFEQMLIDDGALLVKLWFHLSKKAQRKRLKELESAKLTRWRVTEQDWRNFDRYDTFAKTSERVLRETSTGDAPWVVIEGADPNYRALTAGNTLLAMLRDRLEGAKAKKAAKENAVNGATAKVVPPPFGVVSTSGILANLPFEERLSKEKYETRVVKMQGRLNRLSRNLKRRSVVVVLEGMDAAGKGGAIRRITQALDARQYDVIAISAPTEDERAQHYLWRFWKHLPASGRFTIYDRSWYGRVLVERVEGYASAHAWSRAYAEINEFEEQLTDHGTIVVKLWLATTKEEQLKRFKERERLAHKRFKITPDDWRNRKRWDDYIVAASDMIDRTSTAHSPWTVLEANDKHLARVRAIEAMCERIKLAR